MRSFLARGKELFQLLKDAVNVTSVLEMGQLQLHFTEKLDLIRPGRTIVRQGFLYDTQGTQLEMWLFNDSILCGVPIPSRFRLRDSFFSPLSHFFCAAVEASSCYSKVRSLPSQQDPCLVFN